jgi:hypothetical protein
MERQAKGSQTVSPDEQVAQRIVAQLSAHGLIAPAQAAALHRDLAAGVLKAADWRQIAIEALQPETLDAQPY